MHVSIVPAADETTTVAAAAVLPVCRAALADLPPGTLTPPRTSAGSVAADRDKGSAADTAKLAASEAADANHAATGPRGVKGVGTIVSATDGTVTLTVAAPDPGQPAEITATIAPDVVYLDGNTAVAGRPSLNAGDRVFFGATQADDGSYQLVYLQAHPPERDLHPGATVDPAAKAAGAVDDSGYVKALAEVVSVEPGSLSVKLTSGPLANQVVTAATGPDTAYAVGARRCVEPELTAGRTVAVLLVLEDDGSYTARQVQLFQPS